MSARNLDRGGTGRVSGRGWTLARAAALAVTAALMSPVSPLVLVCVPLAVFLVAYRSTSFGALFLAAAIVAFVFSVAPPVPSPVWYGERAWALLLGGGFVLAGLVYRNGSVTMRSIIAVGAAFAVVLGAAAWRPALLSELDWLISGQIRGAAQMAYTWLDAGGASWASVAATIEDVVEIQVLLYPAFLGLASLAGLAVAWYILRRLGGQANALGALRDFRFADQLIWLLIAGLLLFLLPVGQLATRLGENALVFMGSLYVLRGMAVMLWLAAAVVTSVWTAALWAVAAMLLYPVVVGAALLLGLSDTWFDLRRRLRGRPSAE